MFTTPCKIGTNNLRTSKEVEEFPPPFPPKKCCAAIAPSFHWLTRTQAIESKDLSGSKND